MKITAVLFFILQVDLLLVSSSILSRSELKNNSISATEASQSKQQTVPLMMKGKQRSERMLFSRRVNDRQKLHATKPKAVTEPRKRSPPKNPKAGTESTKLSRSKVMPNPVSPRCSARGDSCVPHGHSLCCGPCVSCHCRFFNAVCYCRKTNSQCSKKG